MSELQKCKHLDHNADNYPSCQLKNVEYPGYEFVKYWTREDPDGKLQDVQFCELKGRIRGILACYDNIDRCSSYDPENGV
jgi:hypothetical protein